MVRNTSAIVVRCSAGTGARGSTVVRMATTAAMMTGDSQSQRLGAMRPGRPSMRSVSGTIFGAAA